MGWWDGGGGSCSTSCDAIMVVLTINVAAEEYIEGPNDVDHHLALFLVAVVAVIE